MEVVVSSMDAKPDLITLDLLGGCSSKDLDLGMNSSSFVSCHADLHPLDLNLHPHEGANSAAAVAPPPLAASQSVCTIEKVKLALERAAERESRGRGATEEEEQQPRRQRRPRRGREQTDADGANGSISPSPSSSSSITTASIKRRADAGEEGTTSDGCESAAGGGSLVAAGCPSCLSYVLISKENPRCPRCEAEVPPPATATAAPVAPLQKKPRIDLNFSLGPL